MTILLTLASTCMLKVQSEIDTDSVLSPLTHEFPEVEAVPPLHQFIPTFLNGSINLLLYLIPCDHHTYSTCLIKLSNVHWINRMVLQIVKSS